MITIKEILTLDLQESIKSVIDIEDRSELEIQQEIESYIVTEGIGKHLNSFINQYTSKPKETGVWVSGFYGSGKSYFGKMVGYIIANPMINGTPAIERFIPRLKGLTDESLIENSIRRLESIKSRVIFLDIAKQNTDHGLAFTLFTNFLKNLGFRDNLYGYMEFYLYTEGKYDEFKNAVKRLEGRDWDELKTNKSEVPKIMRRVFYEMGYSEDDYNNTRESFSAEINTFSPSKLKEELEQYLKYETDETLVFVFDEASEGINQKKFTLSDLEGISEVLSSVSDKVWTIAIAQEKLDDVINNSNISRKELTKVTDRFRTKIHLESTEVDVIIRNRLLSKKESSFKELVNYYKNNQGLISDITTLKSTLLTKTTNAEEFATYYPFHKYQFDILQKFLFKSNTLVSTQIAARGMIITAFDVLQKQMMDKDLFTITPGHAICSQAQTAPPTSTGIKYNSADKILKGQGSSINGELLLKTIHLLTESEDVSPTVENITKSYISSFNSYYQIKPQIEGALRILVEAKILLLSNNNYKITSDLEGKLLEEMKDFDVEFYSKKQSLIKILKEAKLFNKVAKLDENGGTFGFKILSDQEDELVPGDKELIMSVYSLFNISGNREDFIEQIKLETQYNKNLITLVPDNSDFIHIDKLIEEVSRHLYMEEKYSGESDKDKRQIIADFSLIRKEKQKELEQKLENAYTNASLIYMFDEYRLSSSTFKSTITDIQRKLLKNVYTKRLSNQLTEGLIPKVFKNRKENLSTLFSGDDFKFFDSQENFIGDHLRVVEELDAKIKSRYIDGKTLEADLSGAPWGYSFGTIVTTLAILLRSGRLSVKYNGEIWFSHEQTGVHEAFTNATKFKSAQFKSITKALTTYQKNSAVQLLMDLNIEQHTDHKVDWNINDYELADSIRLLADHFVGVLGTLNNSVNNFETLFPNVTEQKRVLQEYTSKVTESNYIEKVELLLSNSDQFQSSVNTILNAQDFIKLKYSNVRDLKKFIEDVDTELKKAALSDAKIKDAYDEFMRLYNQDMVKNYNQLKEQAQIVKDSYFLLIKNAASSMAQQYRAIEGKVDAAIRDLNQNYPADLNFQNRKSLDKLKQYSESRVIKEPSLEYSTTCSNCGFSLSDMLNYIEMVQLRENEIQIIKSKFVSKAQQPGAPKNIRRVKLHVPNKVMTVQDYRSLLTTQLTSLASAKPEEEIELDIEMKEDR